MNYRVLTSATAVAIAAALVSACTMKKQEAPPLSGPSEFALSITVNASPDMLAQDGASQSLITITARDINGQPVRNLTMRAEIQVAFLPVDYGSLSARSVVTDSNGRATVVYTAPAGGPVDDGMMVSIVVTPEGQTDYLNNGHRYTNIRLVPPGVVIPPDGMQPKFTFNPEEPTDNQPVLFDATESTSVGANPIKEFNWNFGDGDRASGPVVSHAFERPGTFIVTLTVVDYYGRSASTSQSIPVGAGLAPGAVFSFSPTEPLPTDQVNFNAAQSRAAPGRRIVSYKWDMGDGSPAKTGVQVSHTYNKIGTFVVTLTVVDDVGRVGTATRDVPVGVSDDDEGGL